MSHSLRPNQWNSIIEELLRTHASGALNEDWYKDVRESQRWKAFVPMGRGRGRAPKFEIKQHRGNHYRASNALDSCGAIHVATFLNKGLNHCEICNHIEKDFELSALDYFPFYKSGEIFSWYDPAWLAGYIPFDPRLPEQPEDAPFVVKWICNKCYDKHLKIVQERFKANNRRWARIKRSIKPDGRSRVLIDRRVRSDQWFPQNAPDRRVTSRRSTDVGETWAEQLDRLAHLQQQQRELEAVP